MKPERRRSGAGALHQRGFALIAMLVLAAMVTAYLVAMGLNRSRAELSNEREDHDMKALAQAKAALISYAASEQWQLFMGGPSNQPGGLPCPDRNLPPNGSSSGICNGASQRVGRLPFVTIGSDDLRDASGERLWYAISSDFYRNFGNNVINSDTPGLLTVAGTAPANNVVAIVFAPGQAVQDSTLPGQTQDRSAANLTRTASYLEGVTTAGSDYTYASTPLPTSTFDDRLLAITQADLMAAVEPAVAARIKRTVVPLLNDYKLQWTPNAFPFPARFDAPPGHPGSSGSGSTRSPMTYVGDPTVKSATGALGLLPVAYVLVTAATNASPIVITTDSNHNLSTGDTVWINGVTGNAAANGKWTITKVDNTHFRLNGSAGSGAYAPGSGIVTPSYPWGGWSVTKAGGLGRIDNDSCTTVFPPPPPPLSVAVGLQCTFRARDDFCGASNCISNLSFRIQASVGTNAGRTFAVLPKTSAFDKTLDAAITAFPSESIIWSLATTGAGLVTYTALLPSSIDCPSSCPNHQVIVTIPDVVTDSRISPSDANVGWFVGNEWYRQTFYALAPDLAPGGNFNCNANPPCLTVNNLPPEYVAPANKEAILILAGRVLNGTPRPSASLNDYLEGKNQNGATTTVYEHRSGVPTSINDRVVVVSP